MMTNAHRLPVTALFIVAAMLALVAGAARADVWLAPGDAHARNAAQFLADQPGATGLSTEWPTWVQSSDGSEVASTFETGLRDWLSGREQRAPYRIELRGASAAPLVRTFADEPRARGEVGIRTRYGGDRCGALLQLRLAISPQGDGQNVRPDGTVVGCRLGNWRLTAGWEERWWGPGWNGSIILGTNARPVPGLALTRDVPKASTLPVLKWFGEWRATMFVGRMETDREDVQRPLLFGARLSFRPHRSVEIGLSRTAQLCGKGRPCGFGTFRRTLFGQDNPGDNVSAENEPGNQLAGFDLRLVSPSKAVPVAVYGQLIGEDESSGLPSKMMAVFGGEVWRPLRNGSLLRAVVEYANTTCGFNRNSPRYDCAYVQTLFNREGYRYRGRSLGHGYDNDAKVWSGTVVYTQPVGVSWQLSLHKGRLNRAGVEPDFRNTVSPVRARYEAARLEATGSINRTRWTAGIGYENVSPRVGNRRDDLRAYVGVTHDFGF